MANILIHNVGNQYRHELLMDVPFTAKEVEAVYRNRRKTFDKVEVLPYEPTDVPDTITVRWLLPKGIDHYRRILGANNNLFK